MEQRGPQLQVIAFAAVAAVGISAAYVATTSLREMETSYYELSLAGIAEVYAAAFLACLGAAIAARTRSYNIALIAIVCGALLTFGILLIFSVGVELLILAFALLLAIVAQIRRHAPRVTSVAALGGGLVGLGLTVLTLAATRPPMVACQPVGVIHESTGFPIALGASASTGYGSGNASHTITTGSATEGHSTLVFTCVNGRLVDVKHDLRP